MAASSDEIVELRRQLARMETKIDDLSSLLSDALPHCEKMGAHISFVESIMQRVALPRWLLPLTKGGTSTQAATLCDLGRAAHVGAAAEDDIYFDAVCE